MSVSYFNAPVQIPNAKSLTLADADNSATLQLKPNDVTTSYTIEFPASLGNNNQVLSISSNLTGKATLSWSDVNASSVAADNISLGDAAVNLETSTGNITINAYDNSNIAFQLNNTNALFLDSSSVQFSENAVPSTNDGAALGTTSLMWSDLFLASAGVINFNNGDMTLTHSANDLTVAGGTLTSSGRVLVDDVTDATTTTDGSLQTDGGLSVAKAIFNGTSATLASVSGTVTMGSTTAATVSATGIVNVNNTTDATTTTDGSLQTDGGLSVVKDAVFGNDVKLLSDAAVLNFGADSDVSLTHVADTGLLLNTNMQLQFRDATEYINSSADGQLDINATTEIQLTSTRANVAGTLYAANPVHAEDGTESTSTSTGALIVSGGVGVAKNVNVGGNVAIENKLTFGMDRFTTLGATTGARSNLFATSNVSSIKSIEIDAAASFASIPAGASGQMLHLFYTNNTTGNTQIDFGSNNLYAGSGTAQYLEFTQTGQSATLVYINGDNGVGGWRIINTGATVS